MKTPEEYFDSLLSTDANCPVDVYAHKYNRADLFRFAEAYHEAKMKEVTDEDIMKWAIALFEAHMELEDESPISYSHKRLCLYQAQGYRAGARAMRDGKIKHT